MVHKSDVAIIGAGIAGLSAALNFEKAGIDYVLLEKSAIPGGRIRSVQKDGFTLDAGFQVLHPNYPEVRNCGVWESLHFSSFRSGAFLSREKSLQWYGNPFLDFSDFVWNGFSLPFSIQEYPSALQLFWEALKSDEDFQQTPVPQTTMKYLKMRGFSDNTIQRFFVPFFGGVFLDQELGAGRNYFLWILKKFMQGKPGLPVGGMQSLPLGLAAQLPANGKLHFLTEVKGYENGQINCTDGKQFQAKFILDSSGVSNSRLPFRATRNIYLFGPKNQNLPKALILNGNNEGNILHFCFPSTVQPTYAPESFSLCSITVRDPEKDLSAFELQKELKQLYPKLNWATWEILESFYVKKAIPEHQTGTGSLYREKGTVFFAGDGESYPSINGAMRSGREAAEAIIQKLRN